jgi:SAM-dependent methyltransferase
MVSKPGSRTTAAKQEFAERAIRRQLDYQRERASARSDRWGQTISDMTAHSLEVRAKLEAVRPISDGAKVLEVGSGSEGLIFFFGSSEGIGLDPLAKEYAAMLPWHNRVRTVSAFGEDIPFADASFDVVLCDNVIDHAEDPQKIITEIDRVLSDDGILYFTVNVHHQFWHLASGLHNLAESLGIRLEVSPFADHTFHFTRRGALSLFNQTSFNPIKITDTICEQKRLDRASLEGATGLAKYLFFKNAQIEVIATKSGQARDRRDGRGRVG